jgi:hypothetical protein
MSTPELLIGALQQVRLSAENLIRLGALPSKLSLLWLAEFAARGGLLALFSYMQDFKRHTPEYVCHLRDRVRRLFNQLTTRFLSLSLPNAAARCAS